MNIKKYLSGIALVVFLTALAVFMQQIPLLKNLSISAVIIAILLGMLVKNTIGTSEEMSFGIKFCSKKVLRLAIILLGFKLSFMEVSKLGLKAASVIIFVSTITLLFTKYLGKKLNISRNLALLIAAGTSICGASAIAAVSSVAPSDNDEDIPFAVGVVTIFGTIFMMLYPLCFNVFHLNTLIYSLWAGSSIHEVAQVVAAGFAASNQAGISATIVKLTRVLLIIPVTIILGIRETKKGSNSGEKFMLRDVVIPWFVLMFLGIVIVNSMGIVSPKLSKILIEIDNYLMAAAMVALGLETSISGMKKVGLKPIYLGAMSSLFISIFSLGIIYLIN